MIVMFGKGKVGNGVKRLLGLLGKECILMDDQDYDDNILSISENIVITPGIKQSHKIYQTYNDKIRSELNFLYEFIIPNIGFESKPDLVGITATNGKSTTTWVTYNVLKGILHDREVWITGNFDVSLSDVLSEILEKKLTKQKHVFVIEASSFMLYKLKEFFFDYSILLNIAVDHLDRHKDREEYRDSKLNILKNIKKRGITSSEVFEYLGEEVKPHTKIYDGKFDLSKTNFLGKHNQENLSAVYLLSKLYFQDNELNWNQDLFDIVLNKIKPLAHRLSLIAEIDGIKIYDDGICTSSHALNVALGSFEKRILLVAGGYDKGEDYDGLQDVFQKSVGFAVLMGQTSFKFEKLCKSGNIDYVIVDNLHDGIQSAWQKAKYLNFDTILYSPGSASFDMFKNVYHRVEEFEKEISLLK